MSNEDNTAFIKLILPSNILINKFLHTSVYLALFLFNTTVFYFLIYLYLCYSFSNDAMLLAGGQYHILQVDLHVSTESQTIWIVHPHSVYTRV